jgi:hypothetical protein
MNSQYKARILKRKVRTAKVLPGSPPYRRNIIMNTIVIPIMVMEPSYRTKCEHLQGFKCLEEAARGKDVTASTYDCRRTVRDLIFQSGYDSPAGSKNWRSMPKG